MKSGLLSFIIFLSLSVLQISKKKCLESFSMSKSTKFEGLVGISDETPITSAPSLFSQIDNHEPLNPVLPVIKTFLFL